jgi:hypothetical protein
MGELPLEVGFGDALNDSFSARSDFSLIFYLGWTDPLLLTTR